MSVFMQNDLPIQVPIPSRGWTVPQKHLQATRQSIRRRGEIRVVKSAAVLGVGLNRIVVPTTAAEVLLLEIARGFGEPEFIQPVVHPIAPVKQLHHRRAGRLLWVRLGIEREVEYAKRRSVWSRQIRHVVGVPVQMCVHVVSRSFIIAVVDPAGGRRVRGERANRNQLPRHWRGLGAQGSGMPRRKRRRTITCKNAIGRVGHVIGQTVPKPDFSRLRTDQNPEHFSALAAGENDGPTQAKFGVVERQPDQTGLRLASQRRRRELVAATGIRLRL